MLALETIPGVRIVADSAVLDGMVVAEGAVVLRFAPDEAFAIMPKPGGDVDEGSPKAMVVRETGFVGCWLTPDELTVRVLAHVDWALPAHRPMLVQGLVAGVPAKLWLETGRALLLCAAPYAHELEERLG
ncbi:MAG: hypothetical protein ACRDGI_10715 [Candidatus Limnocylindrales bacterium]